MKNKTYSFYVLKVILLAPTFLCYFQWSAIAADQYTIIDLGTLGGSTSIAYDINDIGQVVGAAQIKDIREGVYYANLTMLSYGKMV